MAASVFDVFASEHNTCLRALSANESLAAFVQAIIEHMTLFAASKGIRSADITITDPYIDDHLLGATVSWATWNRGAVFEALRARSAFADFAGYTNSRYAQFVQGNDSVRRFVTRVLELLTHYANHRGVTLAQLRVEYPYIAHDRYVRAILTAAE